MAKKITNIDVNTLSKIISNLYDKIFEELNVELRDTVTFVIESAFKKAVDEFYDGYKLRGIARKKSGKIYTRYKRRKSMENILKILPEGYDEMKITFDYKKMVFSHNREDYDKKNGTLNGLFNQTFVLGWHGGADCARAGIFPPHPDPGVPYWRHENFTQWYIPAKKKNKAGLAPLEDFQSRLDDYSEYDAYDDLHDILLDILSNLGMFL